MLSRQMIGTAWMCMLANCCQPSQPASAIGIWHSNAQLITFTCVFDMQQLTQSGVHVPTCMAHC